MIDVGDLMCYFKEQGLIKAIREERQGNIQFTCPKPHFKFNLYTGKLEEHYDKRPSAGIMVEEPYLFSCFACGFRGTIEELVAELLEINPLEAVRWLEKRYDYDENYNRRLAEDKLSKLPEFEALFQAKIVLQEYPESAFDQFRVIHKYTLDRGFSPEIARKYELGYDASQHRVAFPIRNSRGKIVGIIGRAIEGYQEPKYLVYGNFNRGDTLYLNRLPEGAERKKKVIVVEGALDVPWADQLGLCEEYDVAAIMGSKVTAYQAGLLAGYQEVIQALDADYAGETGVVLLKKYLDKRTVVSDLTYPPGKKDLGECNRAEMDEAIRNRKTGIQAVVSQLSLWVD